MIQKTLLTNNVVLITQDVPHAKSVAVGFYYLDAGSRYEADGQRGISHFCEHMLFKGTASLTTHDIALVFDRMGGYVNAFTERDDVCTYCTVPAMEGNLERAVDVFCQMSCSCAFLPQETENERTVIQNEITAVQDDAEESAMDAIAEALWPDQPLGRTITGTADDVDMLTREDLLAWYDSRFVHGELAVVACGALGAQSQAFLREKLSALPLRHAPLAYPGQLHCAERAVWHPSETFREDRRFSLCQMYALYPFAVPLSHERLSALCVLNAVMGDTMSSRLFEDIREKNGACYSTYSFYTSYEDAAFWGASASCDRKNAVRIASLLQDEVDSLRSRPPTDEELSIAKEHIVGEEFLAGEDMEALMKRHFRHYAMGLDLLDTEKIIAGIRGVQKHAIMDFIDELLVRERRVFFVYGPRLSAAQKREMLCRTK